MPTVTFDINALPATRRAEAKVRFQASLCEFMVYKVALGQFFLQVLFSPCQYYFT
jgi:hypothetical protein